MDYESLQQQLQELTLKVEQLQDEMEHLKFRMMFVESRLFKDDKPKKFVMKINNS